MMPISYQETEKNPNEIISNNSIFKNIFFPKIKIISIFTENELLEIQHRSLIIDGEPAALKQS